MIPASLRSSKIDIWPPGASCLCVKAEDEDWKVVGAAQYSVLKAPFVCAQNFLPYFSSV